jgi:hypothetical protein
MGHLEPPWSDQRISVNQPLNHQNVYICLYMYNHVCFSVHLCFPVRLCLRFTLSYAMCFARRPFDRWLFSDGDVRYKSGRAGGGDETKVGARLTSLLRHRPVAMRACAGHAHACGHSGESRVKWWVVHHLILNNTDWYDVQWKIAQLICSYHILI